MRAALLLVLGSCGSSSYDAPPPQSPPQSRPQPALVASAPAIQTVTWQHVDPLPDPGSNAVYFDADHGGYRSLIGRLNTELPGSPENLPLSIRGTSADAVAFYTFEHHIPLGLVARITNADKSVEILQCWDKKPAQDRIEVCRAELEKLAAQH